MNELAKDVVFKVIPLSLICLLTATYGNRLFDEYFAMSIPSTFIAIIFALLYFQIVRPHLRKHKDRSEEQ